MLRQLPAVVAIVVACTGCHAKPEEPAAAFQLDNRQWQPLQKNAHRGQAKDFLLELVPAGQTKKDWSELVTLEYFATPTKPVAPEEFKQEFLKRLSAGKPGVGYQLISKDEATGAQLFTWQAVADPRLESQQGLVRVQPVAGGLHVFEYTSRHAIPEEDIQRWKTIMEQGHLDQIGT
jgi:hypothetical protein